MIEKVSSYKEEIYKVASKKKGSEYDPYKATKMVGATNIVDHGLDMLIDTGTMAGGLLIGSKIGKKKGFVNKAKEASKIFKSNKAKRTFEAFKNQQKLAIPIGAGIGATYTALAYLKDKKDAEKLKSNHNIKKVAYEEDENVEKNKTSAKSLIDKLSEKRTKDSMGRDIFDIEIDKGYGPGINQYSQY